MEAGKQKKRTKALHLETQCPEGGWGWVVCLGAFVVNFLTVGQQNSAGVVYSILVDEYKSNRGDTAWITSLASSSMYLFAHVCTALSERYGSRLVVIIGAFVAALGLLGSSFAPNLTTLYFTYGMVWGMGASFGLFPSLVILSRYFRKRLALVTGIALSGAAVGSLLYGPVLQALAGRYGTAGTFRILALLQVMMLLSGLSFREPTGRSGMKRDARRTFEWSVFRKPAFIAWTVALSIFMLVFMVPFVHMVRLAVDMGTGKTEASFLTSFLATGTFTGSIVFGKLADWRPKYRIHICQLGLMGIGLASTLVTMATRYEHVIVYAFAFGLFDGCYEMIVPVITENIVGTRRVGHAIGGLYSILAFPKTLGPPIAGWIYDVSQSYDVAFQVTGGVTTLAVVILFFIPNFTSFRHRDASRLSSEARLLNESPSVSSASRSCSTSEEKVSSDLSDNILSYSGDGAWLKKNILMARSYEYLIVEKLTCV